MNAGCTYVCRKVGIICTKECRAVCVQKVKTVDSMSVVGMLTVCVRNL
jgi:hypothetical protein